MRTLLLPVLALLLAGCGRTATWAVNAGVDEDRIESRTYVDRGLALDVHHPRRGSRGAPVVVFFHGGKWRNGGRGEYRFVGERLADAGALVLVPDFRQAPLHAFPAFMDDAAAAVAWARAHAAEFGGDPQRIFVMGHSSGAHIAALLATDKRYLETVGMPPKSLAGVIGLAGPYDFLPITDMDLIDVFGTGERWPMTQPVNAVDGDEPPFLLVHGDDDDTVRPANSASLAAKLRAAGIPVRHVVVPDRGHAALLLDIRLGGDRAAWTETLRFLGLEVRN
jgi:acetyl esterase/lipase